MADELRQTVKITRRPKVTTDDRGRTVWVDTVVTANLELVSTQMLRQIVDADDGETKDHLRHIAEGEDGLLAHGIDNTFEMYDSNEMRQFKPTDFYDDSLIRELDQSGFIDSFYQ